VQGYWLSLESSRSNYAFKSRQHNAIEGLTMKDFPEFTHTHPFDEYVVCVYGRYTVLIGGKEVVLEAGDEFLIPKGTEHGCSRIAGTRTIHAFGGKRIQKNPKRR
jgi:mannose-6-phosphate isomerase-like protein (cupin superfamily)